MEKEIVIDQNLVSYCGLYCGSCGKYKNGKCPGCEGFEKASWCKVRSCCIENEIKSCADCKEYENPDDCKHYNNFMAKVFSFIFRSDRTKGIEMIKEKGYEEFSRYMAENALISMKKA